MKKFNPTLAEANLKQQIYKKVQLTETEWVDFYNRLQVKYYSKGDFITVIGKTEPYFYFVVDGIQRFFFLKDGKEIDIGFSYQNSFSGVYDAFLTQQPSRYNIQVLEDSILLGITYKDLNELFDRYKNIERWGRLINQEALIGKAHREIAILSYSAEERYRRLMQQSPHCFHRIPQKYLASYLAMTPETFSRLRRKVRL